MCSATVVSNLLQPQNDSYVAYTSMTVLPGFMMYITQLFDCCLDSKELLICTDCYTNPHLTNANTNINCKLLTSGSSTCQWSDMDYMSIDFGVESSSRFPFRTRTHRHIDAQIHTMAITSEGDDAQSISSH